MSLIVLRAALKTFEISSSYPAIKMSVISQLPSLKNALSPTSEILTDAASPVFQHHLERWTDIDKQTPAAIIVPVSEEDIQKSASSFSAVVSHHFSDL